MAISEFYLEQQAIIKKLNALKDNPNPSLEQACHMLRLISKAIDNIAGVWDTAAKRLAADVYRIAFDNNKCFRVLPPEIGMRPSGWRIEAEPHPATTSMPWVENFTAVHPRWGTVEGNFNHKVTAHGGKTAYDEFVKAHPCMELHWHGVKQ